MKVILGGVKVVGVHKCLLEKFVTRYIFNELH
jgi:hypothetical protein